MQSWFNHARYSNMPTIHKHLVLFIAAAALTSSVSAQFDRATTRQECTRRCTNDKTSTNSVKMRHDGIMKTLGEKMDVETDPDKRKQLSQDKGLEMERYEDAHEKMCGKICQHNPEE